MMRRLLASADVRTSITSTVGGRTSASGRGRRRWLAAVAMMTCASLAAACGSGSSNSPSSSSAHAPIKVGYLLPLTGVFTRNGTSELDGFKLGLAHFGTSPTRLSRPGAR
jgi:hypothetical protein